MPDKKLLETLEALHEDLSQAERVDPEAERLLRAVTEDVQRLLDKGSPTASEEGREHASRLSSRLEDVVLHFEADHPRIAALVNQVAEALANLGI